MEVDNVTQQYAVPMQGALFMQMPQSMKVVEQTPADVNSVIEEMSGAAGADSPEIKALESQIASMSKALDDDTNQSAYQTRAIAAMEADYNTREADWQSCKYNNLAKASKKWSCKSGYKDDGYRSSERASLDALNNQINQTYQTRKALDAKIEQAKVDLPKLKSDLQVLRESSVRANMTNEERNTYDTTQSTIKAQQTQAEAAAEAQKKTAEVTAQAQAEAILKTAGTKSKTLLIVGVAVAIALIGGVVFFIIKKKPKGAMPAIKPAMPAVAK